VVLIKAVRTIAVQGYGGWLYSVGTCYCKFCEVTNSWGTGNI